jgi:SepF-like predicted cell division protein (DUF552 family)
MAEKYQTKSVVISRKPGVDENWSAFIGLFEENNPHLKAKVPIEVIEIKNIEKVRIRDLINISYYLRGNDIVINDLKEIHIDVQDKIAVITGIQKIS